MNRTAVPKAKIIIQFCIFLWIVVANFTVQLFHPQLEGLHFATWAFFMVNIFFFTMEEPDLKQRFLQVLCGSLFGLLGAFLLAIVYTVLTEAGMPILPATMIPLSIVLALIINLHAFFPMVFNNCAFAYFTVALIDPEAAFAHFVPYAVTAVAGHVIVNGVAILIMVLMGRHFASKAALAAGAQ